jgi:hypothetical protein
MTAAEVRSHVVQLEAERFAALEEGLGDVAAYMTDLDDELRSWRELYVMTAVTEIAELRGEISGPQYG